MKNKLTYQLTGENYDTNYNLSSENNNLNKDLIDLEN